MPHSTAIPTPTRPELASTAATIGDMVTEVCEACFTNLSGACAVLWGELYEEDGHEVMNTLIEAASSMVAEQGRQVLDNRVALKAVIIGALMTLIKGKMDRDIGHTLRRWAIEGL
jgi:hypothetical protein